MLEMMPKQLTADEQFQIDGDKQQDLYFLLNNISIGVSGPYSVTLCNE